MSVISIVAHSSTSKGLLHNVHAQEQAGAAVRWRLTAHVKRSRSLRALRLTVGGYAENIVSRVVPVGVEVACVLRRAILGHLHDSKHHALLDAPLRVLARHCRPLDPSALDPVRERYDRQVTTPQPLERLVLCDIVLEDGFRELVLPRPLIHARVAVLARVAAQVIEDGIDVRCATLGELYISATPMPMSKVTTHERATPATV